MEYNDIIEMSFAGIKKCQDSLMQFDYLKRDATLISDKCHQISGVYVNELNKATELGKKARRLTFLKKENLKTITAKMAKEQGAVERHKNMMRAQIVKINYFEQEIHNTLNTLKKIMTEIKAEKRNFNKVSEKKEKKLFDALNSKMDYEGDMQEIQSVLDAHFDDINSYSKVQRIYKQELEEIAQNLQQSVMEQN